MGPALCTSPALEHVKRKDTLLQLQPSTLCASALCRLSTPSSWIHQSALGHQLLDDCLTDHLCGHCAHQKVQSQVPCLQLQQSTLHG